MQLKTQEAFVIDQGHDASCQRAFEAVAFSFGYQVTLVTAQPDLPMSSFYGLGLAPLSNWSTFQCHRLGPQKDPTCLNGRQSTQVASSKSLKWPRLFPAYGLVHCPSWH